MPLPVTLTIAAATAILNLWLALRIAQVRVKDKVLHGDGGDPAMAQRIRAHANFVEYAPFVLILMALIELAGGRPFWLWVAGVGFVFARIAHGLGMDRAGSNPFRAGGILATWLLLVLLAGWALTIAYGARLPAQRVIGVEVAPTA